MMEEKSLSYAAYWRYSLADADLGKGALTKKDLNAFKQLHIEEFERGRIGNDVVAQFFENEPGEVERIAVTLRPFVYTGRLEHGILRAVGAPEVVTTIVTKASIARDGRIYSSGKTFIPRDILEPLEKGSFSIGTVADLDSWLEAHSFPDIDTAPADEDPANWHERHWEGYKSFCKEMLEAITNGWPRKGESFSSYNRWLIVKDDSVSGASRHILPLYDHIRRNNPVSPLFDTYAAEEVLEPEPCLPPLYSFCSRVGHSSNQFPLTDAQRDAMSHHVLSRHGEILGVNGPPGTGKTTLVLSVVASHWVQAALDGAEPPVVAAASTNNQAVTNIIDAFAKDFSLGTGPFAGRWLPDIKSFGAYYPSKEKEKKLANTYQTKAFFDRIETDDYVSRAEHHYLELAAAALPELSSPTVPSVVERLHRLIHHEVDKLHVILAAWEDLLNAREELTKELGNNPEAELSARRQAVGDAARRLADLQSLERKMEAFLAGESLLTTLIYALFSWCGPVARRHVLVAKEHLKGSWPGEFPKVNWASIDEISAYILQDIRTGRAAFEARTVAFEVGEKKTKACLEAEEKWRTATASLRGGRDSRSFTLADCDREADKAIRFQAFLLATHYWEGRWLIEMKDSLSSLGESRKRTGPSTAKKRWYRRMKLTPCVVSTFFMLPAEMAVKAPKNGQCCAEYLYDFLDLLIVDEAGQVLPEVAGASFSLAKRAMVIGDTLQIAPIWSMKRRVDIGNLVSAGVIPGMEAPKEYARIEQLGKTAASGSVMNIAQSASRYHYDSDLARGMYLHEHYRCYNEIIKFCNELCYRNKLIPRRGIGSGKGSYPPLGFLHINGICERSGSSCHNILEADTIAAWIVQHRTELEGYYRKGIDEIVGVITPFGPQVAAIARACQEAGIPVGKQAGEMSVGTVHSFQGAERPVIIFSSTYSIHLDGSFIDQSPSMLNVAVSRAKDAFFVFGDMEIFNARDTGLPRGLLASYLFSDDSIALEFPPQPRKDLYDNHGVIGHLVNAEEHDAFLLQTLTEASREVHIVSPWIRQRILEEAGILKAMTAAATRGVAITIYTDQSLNLGKNEGTRGEWDAAALALNHAGLHLVDVPRLHTKMVACDNAALCIGSFNWLSAARTGQYVRHETSIYYRGEKVSAEIQSVLHSLMQRAARPD